MLNHRYVCGFQIHPELKLVTLVRKQKPKWQAGLLNGIGGSIEDLCHCNHIRGVHAADGSCLGCAKLSNILVRQCPGYQIMRAETPLEAMYRECYEETGRRIRDWTPFCEITGSTHPRTGEDGRFCVYFFRQFTYGVFDMGILPGHQHNETISIESIYHVRPDNAIPNLPWLLMMAHCITADTAKYFKLVERYSLDDVDI